MTFVFRYATILLFGMVNCMVSFLQHIGTRADNFNMSLSLKIFPVE